MRQRTTLSICLGLLALLGGTDHGRASAEGPAVLLRGRGPSNQPLSRASRGPTHATLAEAHAASKLAARLAWANTWSEYKENHAATLRRVKETGSLGEDRFLVCVFQSMLGWGNRVTPIFTAAIIALLTNRMLLVRMATERDVWSDELPVWDYLEPQPHRLIRASGAVIKAEAVGARLRERWAPKAVGWRPRRRLRHSGVRFGRHLKQSERLRCRLIRASKSAASGVGHVVALMQPCSLTLIHAT